MSRKFHAKKMPCLLKGSRQTDGWRAGREKRTDPPFLFLYCVGSGVRVLADRRGPLLRGQDWGCFARNSSGVIASTSNSMSADSMTWTTTSLHPLLYSIWKWLAENHFGKAMPVFYRSFRDRDANAAHVAVSDIPSPGSQVLSKSGSLEGRVPYRAPTVQNQQPTASVGLSRLMATGLGR